MRYFARIFVLITALTTNPTICLKTFPPDLQQSSSKYNRFKIITRYDQQGHPSIFRNRLLSLVKTCFKLIVLESTAFLSQRKSASATESGKLILDNNVIREITNGRVMVCDNWISPNQIKSLREEISAMVFSGKFKASGLSNTALGMSQNFKDGADRTVCPVPLYNPSTFKSSISRMSSNAVFIDVAQRYYSRSNLK